MSFLSARINYPSIIMRTSSWRVVEDVDPYKSGSPFLATARSHCGSNTPRVLFTPTMPLRYLTSGGYGSSVLLTRLNQFYKLKRTPNGVLFCLYYYSSIIVERTLETLYEFCSSACRDGLSFIFKYSSYPCNSVIMLVFLFISPIADQNKHCMYTINIDIAAQTMITSVAKTTLAGSSTFFITIMYIVIADIIVIIMLIIFITNAIVCSFPPDFSIISFSSYLFYHPFTTFSECHYLYCNIIK